MKLPQYFCIFLPLLISCQLGQDDWDERNYTYVKTRNGIKKVYYNPEEGEALFEGDIILGSLDNAENTRYRVEASGNSKAAIIIDSYSGYWSERVIPYTIHNNLPNKGRVEEAIAHYHDNTDLRFIERTYETDYVTFYKHTENCASYVGKIGGQQSIRLADGCSVGNTIHEMGHAIGLWHEQSRADRDKYITIHWDNMESEYSKNFNQHILDGMDIANYDFASIMHYGPYAFSKNDNPTITKKDGSTEGFGLRDELSEGDISAIQKLYGYPIYVQK